MLKASFILFLLSGHFFFVSGLTDCGLFMFVMAGIPLGLILDRAVAKAWPKSPPFFANLEKKHDC